MTLTFENIAVAISAVLYASVGIGYLAKCNIPWGLVWLSYSAANMGLIWAASIKK